LGSNGLGIGLCNAFPLHLLELGTDSAFKPGSTTWTTGSDRRIKDNIVAADLDRCYDIVRNLPLKRFKWVDGPWTTPGSDKQKIGWIAQEVEQVFPKAVATVKSYAGIDDFLTLDTDQVYAALYGAVQKLQILVQELHYAKEIKQ
jgi:hypothetical protein